LKKKLFTGIITAIIAGISLGAGSAFAWSKSHYGFTPIPAYVQSYDSFNTETYKAIHNAHVQWNSAGEGDLVYQSSTKHSSTTYPNKNSKNQITKGKRGSNDYLMECYTWKNAFNYAYEADIDINVSYPWANNGDPNAYDVQAVYTHEVGHLLGLGHSTDTLATMYPTVDEGELHWRDLHTDDIQGILIIY
jgi:hypothetical protein